MIPCVSLAETSVIGNMKERVKEMKVFGCRLNFWNHIGHSLTSSKTKEGKYQVVQWGIPVFYFAVPTL